MSLIFNSNGLNLMETRLGNRGGAAQQDRMIKDKRRTLDRVVLYSYQGAKVQRPSDPEPVRALINPNKILQDYDDKILSIGYEYDYKSGDVFEWVNTGTKWLIYLQDLTELAYFKGNIRKCSYEIEWEDENGNRHRTYAAIRGPKENSITSIQKFGVSMDLPNYTLNLLLPNNEENLKQFQRYQRFFLQDIKGPDAKICWRVEAVDSISTPGIIEIYAAEYYSNAEIDDIEEGIVGGLIEEEVYSEIKGETFIRPKKTYTFTYEGEESGQWIYDNTLPMEVIEEGKTISIKWNTTYGGEFILKYGSAEKIIVIESLF